MLMLICIPLTSFGYRFWVEIIKSSFIYNFATPVVLRVVYLSDIIRKIFQLCQIASYTKIGFTFKINWLRIGRRNDKHYNVIAIIIKFLYFKRNHWGQIFPQPQFVILITNFCFCHT